MEITIKINGQEMSLYEAKKIYDELHMVFGKKDTINPCPPIYPGLIGPGPGKWPDYSPMCDPVWIVPPWTVTCDSVSITAGRIE